MILDVGGSVEIDADIDPSRPARLTRRAGSWRFNLGETDLRGGFQGGKPLSVNVRKSLFGKFLLLDQVEDVEFDPLLDRGKRDKMSTIF
jgi:hypothetical protein